MSVESLEVLGFRLGWIRERNGGLTCDLWLLYGVWAFRHPRVESNVLW